MPAGAAAATRPTSMDSVEEEYTGAEDDDEMADTEVLAPSSFLPPPSLSLAVLQRLANMG